jgi:hypothetical protein
MFGLLREIRAACQYLQDAIASTLKQVSGLPADARESFLANALTLPLNRADEIVTGALTSAQQLFQTDATQFDWGADTIAFISLAWSEICNIRECWKDANIADRLTAMQDPLDRIVYQCASLTLAPRVNDVMRNLRVGQQLDLEFEFASEFPKDPKLRVRLAQELAQESGVIECGVVDPELQIIYKTAATRTLQLLSVWRIVLWCLAGFAIPIVLANGGRYFPAWPLHSNELLRLLTDYAMIMVGAGAHLAVESLKTSRSQPSQNFGALDDWVLWLHVREASFRRGILYVWLGYILFTFGISKADWPSAFFAGYSIDSFTELFLERFDTVVKSKTSALAALAKQA